MSYFTLDIFIAGNFQICGKDCSGGFLGNYLKRDRLATECREGGKKRGREKERAGGKEFTSEEPLITAFYFSACSWYHHFLSEKYFPDNFVPLSVNHMCPKPL